MKADIIRQNHLLGGNTEKLLCEIMLDLNPCISVIFSANFEPIDCNNTAVEYLGYKTKKELLNNILPDLNKSIPPFQPDASPTISLKARVAYVSKHESHDFEMEIILNGSRVPLRFMMRKVDIESTYVIACFILDTQALKEARNELIRHDFLMRQVNRAATRLFSAEPENFDYTIVKTLKSLTQAVGGCQMAILENHEQDEEKWCTLLYNWDMQGTTFLLDLNENDYMMDYSQIKDWYDILSVNRRINGSGADLDSSRMKYFPRGTKAFMITPIFLQKKFWGTIIVAKSSDDHLFTNAEERAIQSGGILIVASILRNQINQNLIDAREAAMASEQAKSSFLSRMSHEIRTPLNAIIGMTTIAEKTEDFDQVKYSLQKIKIASEQLLNLVNDILDISKIETGKLKVVEQPFDFMQMVQNVIDIQKVAIQAKNQTFHLKCNKIFDHYVITDELRLSQVLINLLGNAVKFTPENGNITLQIDYNKTTENQ